MKKDVNILFSAVYVGVVTACASTIHVAPTGSDTADGASWATAKRTIQAAVRAAAAGDTITVTNGTYAPIATDNTAITIKSVNGPDVTHIDGGSISRCASLGADIFCTNTALIGFTLKNGSADEGGGARYGTLTDCTLTGNTARMNGGGVYRGVLNNCTFSGNTAGSGGGAYYGALNNCTLTGNSATGFGGGASGGTLTGCTFTGNSAGHSGGGACDSTLHNCTLTGNEAVNGGGVSGGWLHNCTLKGNTATDGGGAWFAALTGCTLTGNTARMNGGGAYYGTLNNCMLMGNSAIHDGGGSINATLHNCTLTGNQAGQDSGGVACCILVNCIVWGNTARTNPNYHSGSIMYTCSTPLPGGEGNIAQDPLFVNAEKGDFRLKSGSPCIDAGINELEEMEMKVLAKKAKDLDGKPRILNGTVDMGAYEWHLVSP